MSHDFARSQRLKKESARRKPARRSGGVPSWLWVLIGTLAGGLIMFLVYLSGAVPKVADLAAVPPAASTPEAGSAPAPKSRVPDSPPKRVSPVFEFYTKLPEGGAATGMPTGVPPTGEQPAPATEAGTTTGPIPGQDQAVTPPAETLDPIQQLLAEQEKAKASATVPAADTTASPPVSAAGSKTAVAKDAAKPAGRYLQAGAFRSKGEVEKLRAKISLAGMSSTVQSVTNDKGETLNKVLVGPFPSAAEMDEAKIILGGNGINTIPVR